MKKQLLSLAWILFLTATITLGLSGNSPGDTVAQSVSTAPIITNETFSNGQKVGVTEYNNYYVAPTPIGDDSNDGSFDSPWTTPEKAWHNAQAGDVVYFRGGTYTITTAVNTKYHGYDGTAENPIVFRNYPDETVTFSSSLDKVFLRELFP